MSAVFRSRLAPTPSGFLHLGNILSFVITAAWVKSRQGKLVLRIDDFDTYRSRDAYIEDIFETLEFLEIGFDEGPKNLYEHKANYSQSLKTSRYLGFLEQLKSENMLYACICSRQDILKNSADGKYPFTCRDKGLSFDSEKVAWRIKVDANFNRFIADRFSKGKEQRLIERMPDFVVRRKDGLPAYQISSVVDDLDMHISGIVRGRDLFGSTLAQLYLAHCLGEHTFADIEFIHHPLIKNSELKKLSKSKGAHSIRDMRLNGIKPKTIYRVIGDMLGLMDYIIESVDDVCKHFDFIQMQKKLRQ
jgi:glutamyl/glutaminyl-tRNA synthetase